MNERLLEIYQKDSKPPIYLEVPVNISLKPFLVSSSQTLVWTERVTGGNVWSVPRELGDNIQAEVVAAVVEKSYSEKWSNLFHLTEEGCNNSIKYLRANGFQDIEVLVNPYTGLESIEEEGVTLVESPWMPLACAVFVPEQREYVGNLVVFQEGKFCSICVHNARYGMALAVEV